MKSNKTKKATSKGSVKDNKPADQGFGPGETGAATETAAAPENEKLAHGTAGFPSVEVHEVTFEGLIDILSSIIGPPPPGLFLSLERGPRSVPYNPARPMIKDRTLLLDMIGRHEQETGDNNETIAQAKETIARAQQTIEQLTARNVELAGRLKGIKGALVNF